jgi:hypothetical protein
VRGRIPERRQTLRHAVGKETRGPPSGLAYLLAVVLDQTATRAQVPEVAPVEHGVGRGDECWKLADDAEDASKLPGKLADCGGWLVPQERDPVLAARRRACFVLANELGRYEENADPRHLTLPKGDNSEKRGLRSLEAFQVSQIRNSLVELLPPQLVVETHLHNQHRVMVVTCPHSLRYENVNPCSSTCEGVRDGRFGCHGEVASIQRGFHALGEPRG